MEILKAEDELAIQFYAKQCEKESWSVRELKRQMKSVWTNQLFVSRYQLYLPDKEQLQQELSRLLENE